MFAITFLLNMTNTQSILALILGFQYGQQAAAFVVVPSSLAVPGTAENPTASFAQFNTRKYNTAAPEIPTIDEVTEKEYLKIGMCQHYDWHYHFLPNNPIRTVLPKLSKDPFMKQIGHAEALIELLLSSQDDDDDNQQLQLVLEPLLTAQLSHSDGIRGFFVNYLTASTSDADDISWPADNPMVPEVLQKAMSKVDPEELVPLACK